MLINTNTRTKLGNRKTLGRRTRWSFCFSDPGVPNVAMAHRPGRDDDSAHLAATCSWASSAAISKASQNPLILWYARPANCCRTGQLLPDCRRILARDKARDQPRILEQPSIPCRAESFAECLSERRAKTRV